MTNQSKQSLQSFLPQFAAALLAANNKTVANNTVANFFMLLFLNFNNFLDAIYAFN